MRHNFAVRGDVTHESGKSHYPDHLVLTMDKRDAFNTVMQLLKMAFDDDYPDEMISMSYSGKLEYDVPPEE